MYECERCHELVNRHYCFKIDGDESKKYRTCTQCDDEFLHEQRCAACSAVGTRCKKRPRHDRTCSHCDAHRAHDSCNDHGYELHDNRGRFICYGYEPTWHVYCMPCENWRFTAQGCDDTALRSVV